MDLSTRSRSNGAPAGRVFCLEVVGYRSSQQSNTRTTSLEQRPGDGRKVQRAMKPYAMHPALAEFLNGWRKESCYNRHHDWMFSSSREKGRVPRAASTCRKHYLRPAAVAAGVIAQDDHSRFGWCNLRHSLATFFGSTRFIPQSSKQCSAIRSRRQRLAIFMR